MAQGRDNGSTRWLLLAAVALLLAGLVAVAQGGLPWRPGALAARLVWLMLMLVQQALVALGWLAAAAGWGFAARRALALGAGPAGGSVQRRIGADGQLAFGAALMGLGVWLAGWAGWLTPAAAWGVGGIGALLLLGQVRGVEGRSLADAQRWPTLPWPLVAAAPAVGLLLGCAMLAPKALWSSEHGAYDVLSYHLQLPREWIHAGAIKGLEHNVYSYLPNLWEAVYAQLGLWRSSMVEASYAGQLLHAVMALLAAGAVGRLVATRCDGRAGALAAGVYLATPWTLVTGSLAYTEQAMMAMGAVALRLALPDGGVNASPGDGAPTTSPPAERTGWRIALASGLLCGLAVLCKPTALGFFAAPVGIIWLTDRRGGRQAWLERCAAFGLGLLGVAGLWWTRNAVWTGNPVFPLLAEALGTAHWTADQAARWAAAHRPDSGALEALAALWREGPAHRQFAYLVLPAGLIGAIAAAARSATRRTAAVLILVAVVQVLFWLLGTHHQSRFLIPLLLPACSLVGLGVYALPWRRVAVGGAVLVLAGATLLSVELYAGQQRGGAPHYIGAADLIGQPAPQRRRPSVANVVNALPRGSRLYAEGFATPFYIRRPIRYHTVWDRAPIGAPLQAGGPEAAARWLRERGFTHVLIDWQMLQRWNRPGNYGYDPRVSIPDLRRLAEQRLRRVRRWPGRALYAVPAR